MTNSNKTLFSKDEKFLLYTLAGIQFTHIVDFMLMMPLGPQLMRLFDLNTQSFGILVSTYTFTAGVSGLTSSLFIDRFDRKSALLVLYGGFLLGTLACGMSTNYVTLLLARSLTGAFGGVLSSLILAIIGDVIPNQKRGRALGITMSAFSLAGIAGVPLSLGIANHWNWQAPFIALAGVAALVWILIFWKVPSLRVHMKHETEGRETANPFRFLKSIPGNPILVKALALSSLMILSQFMVIPFLSPVLVANAGMKETELPLVYFVGGVCSIFSSPMIGKLSDLHGRIQIINWVIPLSLIPLLLVTNLNAPLPVYFILPITGLFMILISGRMVPTMALITNAVDNQNRGSFMSVMSSFQQFSSAIASALAGWIIVKEVDGVMKNYWIVGVLACGLSLIALKVARDLALTNPRENAPVAGKAK